MDQLRELKNEAAQAMGRGQWRRALQLYRKLAESDPSDGTWALRAGDAARRLNRQGEAIQWYERAAGAYQKRGFVVRAIAVGKMIQSLDPSNDRILRQLDSAQGSSPGGSFASASGGATPPPPPLRRRRPPASKPPPIPPSAAKPGPPSAPRPAGGAPPLHGRLSGPVLSSSRRPEPSMASVEIVFDDVDDGIPIQDSDILPAENGRREPAGGEPVVESTLLARIPSFPIFEVLPRGGFLSVVSRMDHRHAKPGELIVRQGEPGTSLYAIIDGRALVYLEGRRDRPLAKLGPGAVFGEMALVLDQPRAATVEAATKLELFEMDRGLLGEAIEQHPQLEEVLSRLIKRRLVENVMTIAPLFQRLDPSARQDLMARFEVREVAAGTRLVEQGTPSDGLYLVVAGRVRACRREGGPEAPPQVMAELGPGLTFGAASMIDRRNASPTSFEASDNAVVLRLPRSAFQEVISFYPPVLEHLSEVAEKQQEWTDADRVPVV